MQKKSIGDVELKDKTVFIRVDFNVPIKDGKIEDDTRIRGAVPTIEFARGQGARIILASHLGRPLKDQKKAEEKGLPFNKAKYSLRPVAGALSELLTTTVKFEGDELADQIAELNAGEVLMLENLRLNSGEEKNDPVFARSLAEGIDVYVNDAFGTAHRAHASTEGITHYVETCVAGLLMEKELEFLGKALNDPERPFVAILGGAKVSDKIPVIQSLIERKVDKLLIGGAMAYTFFKAQGFTVGKSLVEDDMMPKALEIEARARDAGVELLLPTDHQVVDSYDPINSRKAIQIEFTNAGLVGLDIGPDTAALFAHALQGARTIVWNGPMGMFEEKPFDEGTIAIANAVAEATDKGATSIVGGGDSVAAVNQAGLADKISHISTGGGATLEFLAGDVLPGVAALDDK
ncbi:MAG TPA: phosphoglycerate kinase [Pyrinomonadaceae bacterium]|nr:phosphoglycerate kinase [Chloracidobacterium sp.]HBE83856.1 phosphoglycerate kinase [Blastocatellia bacterium]HRJ87551.1 phosphoglycerate kinase [Pyrinomonadaceae bacterium]HRK50508.1 phosphoglycerate kinase [Pyrinomonadaceae bacterium]